MRQILLAVLVCTLLYGCNGCNKNEPNQNYVEIQDVKTTSDYENYSLTIPNDTATFFTNWRTCSVNEPRPLSSLNSGSKKFVYLIDRNNQATASLFGLGQLNLSKKEKIAIVDYVEYRDTICTPGNRNPNNTSIRLAAGVRLFLKISNSDKKVNVEIPSKIAAGIEFGLAQATFTIETIGFKNEETRRILGELGESFDVESYVKIMNAVGQVMKTMKDTMLVNPVRIPIK